MSKYKKGTKLWYEREAPEKEFLKWYKTQDQPKYEKPSVTVDLIGLRFNQENSKIQILLVQRIANPNRGKWALPGGFIEPNETTYRAVKREVKEETNLEIDEQQIQLLPLVSTPNRDPRMWVMTNPNIVLFTPEDNLQIKAGDDARNVKFFDIETNAQNEVIIKGLTKDDLAFDHYELITSAVKKMQVELQRRRFDNVWPMMPKQFTTGQALALCQAIDLQRFKKYTTSAIRSMLGKDVKRVGVKTIGVGKPKAIFEFKKDTNF